ncbi:MAG TPA: methyltransferase, partial [Methanosarcina sp.]|nr:methyltransferase [Methanosarcina sp.]
MKTVAEPWPIVKGDYIVGNPKSRIAVVTLASQINPSP